MFFEIACEVNALTQDSDLCLQKSGWGAYKCASLAKNYCDRYGKVTKRCCPETCNEGIALTEMDCKSLNGPYKCTYPFIVEPIRC